MADEASALAHFRLMHYSFAYLQSKEKINSKLYMLAKIVKLSKYNNICQVVFEASAKLTHNIN